MNCSSKNEDRSNNTCGRRPVAPELLIGGFDGLRLDAAIGERHKLGVRHRGELSLQPLTGDADLDLPALGGVVAGDLGRLAHRREHRRRVVPLPSHLARVPQPFKDPFARQADVPGAFSRVLTNQTSPMPISPSCAVAAQDAAGRDRIASSLRPSGFGEFASVSVRPGADI